MQPSKLIITEILKIMLQSVHAITKCHVAAHTGHPGLRASKISLILCSELEDMGALLRQQEQPSR